MLQMLQQPLTDDQSRQEDQQHVLVLTQKEQIDIENLFDSLPAHDPHKRHTSDFYLTSKMLAKQMSERVARQVECFRSEPSAYPQGYLVLRGFPTDPHRSTPRTYGCPVRANSTRADWACLTVGSALGDPFTLANEQDGRIPNAIIALEGKETDRSSASSKANLGFHVDNIASLDASATWLVLCCVKPDANGEGATTVGSLHEALPLISPASLRILRQPIFKVSAPAAFSGKAEPVVVPVIGGSENLPWLTYRSYGLEPIDSNNVVARHALAELDEALNAVARFIKLGAGDLLILRNGFTPLNVVHGRSQYEAYFDDRYVDNRYLLRVYVHRDITQVLDYCYPGTHTMTPTELYRAAFSDRS